MEPGTRNHEVLARLFALETFGIKLGLTNITRLCEALGHPEHAFTSFHVAGTNGKGSVTAMVHEGLCAAGLRAARYTSPHLVDLNERFVIGDAPVADADLHAAAATVLNCADALVASGVLPALPTFFEATTAIAFELFRKAKVDVAVVEVGLGGRFDATNVLTPIVGAITSIGLDHQDHLGQTIESIAAEKAGIIKPGTTIVTGSLPTEAEAVVRRVAAELHAQHVEAHSHVTVSAQMVDGRATIEVRTPEHNYGSITLGLRGEHQIGNALVAIRLMEAARARGVRVSVDAIARGIASARWPARLELMEAGRGRWALIDAAHNPDGAAALATYLRRWHPDRPPLVFGAMRDKDVDGILRALLPVVGPVIVTAAPLTPRADDPEALAARARALDPARIVVMERDPMRALACALEHADLACVAGSIYLAGAVRGALQRRAILR